MYNPTTYSLNIQSKLKNALETHHSSIAGRKHSLQISNIQFDSLPDPENYERQKQILNSRGTEGVHMFGDVKLINNATGEVLDEKKKMKIGHVPTATNRYSFILNGKEYIVHNQTRLRPAIYTKLDRTGMAQADFNLARGANMELKYMPAKGQMMISINKSNVPLYTFLKDVYNVPDKELEASFGKMHAIELANYLPQREINIKKLYGLLFKLQDPSRTPSSIMEMTSQIKKKMDQTSMDPSTNLKTLGKSYSKVDKDCLIHAAQEMLDVYRGDKEPTWKDNLAFKSIHSAEDFLHEKFSNPGQVLRLHNNLKFKIDKADKINKIMLPNHIQKNIKSFFIDSNLVNYPLQVNPMEMLENAHKLTSLGEGGISSPEAVTNDARNLHPSQMGFIDPVRTPDNFNAGVDLRISATAWKEGDTLVTIMKDRHGKNVKMSHTDIFPYYYAVDSEPKLPNGLYRAFHRGEIVEVPKSKIDFWIPKENIFTVTTGSIPFTANSHGQRAAMGAKMTTQALSLVHREPPLVSTTTVGLYEDKFNPKSRVDGVVQKISPTEIHIKDSHTNKIEVHHVPNNFALNYHSYLTSSPLVKEGDKVKKNQVISETNFTKDGGKMSLGVNANVAFMPMKGYNFEDALVVSETGAKKFASEHIFQEELEIPDDSIIVDAKKYVSYYPNKFRTDQLSLLNGAVVRKGVKVHSGDPLILALKRKRESPEVLLLGKMSSRISNPFGDSSLTWDKDYPGEVLDVIEGKGFIKVVIKATAPLVVGDKLCFDSATEILCEEGWVNVRDINLRTTVLGPDSSYNLIPQRPYAIHKYPLGGDMVRIKSEELDLFITKDHDVVVRDESSEDKKAEGFKKIRASKIVGKKNIRFKTRFSISPHWASQLGDMCKEFLFIPEDPLYKESIAHLEKDYRSPVYCVSVGTGMLVVRRNGKICVVGNCGRFGNKGIVGAIIPDSEAPRTKAGLIPDVFMHPIGISSRMNVGQLFETALGKVLKEKGKGPIKVSNFSGENTYDAVNRVLKHEGVTTQEDYIDPLTKKIIPNVFSGSQYVLKLAKQTEVNYSARAGGEYDIDMRPIKGGDEGAKNIGNLDFYGFLAHNSRNLLREAGAVKSQYNPEVWQAILSGKPLPAPAPTFTFEKMKSYLMGMGIDVKKEGNNLKMIPFTDKGILELSNGEIKEPTMVMNKPDPVTGLKYRPEERGLFDPSITGGLAGSKFSHIALEKPVANSLFLKPIRTLLDLQQKDYKEIASGEKTIQDDKGRNLTGGEAIKYLLGKINVERDIPILQTELENTKSLMKRDTLTKKLKYLRSLKEMGLEPKEAYVLHNIPVIPPKFRPIYPKETGEIVVTDANHLYKDLIQNNLDLKSPLSKALGDDDPHTRNLIKSLHETVEKIQGLDGTADSPRPGEEREPVGFLKILTGSQQVKNGYFQGKLLSRSQDLVGRGTIAPGPEFGLDQIGLPEPMCWKLYGPFVIGDFVKNGYELPKAKEEVEKRTQAAKNLLLAQMAKRPCIVNRAPTLHKFSVMAFWPQLIQGRSIKLCPLVVGGFGADFDGDTLSNSVFARFEKADTESHKSPFSWYNDIGSILDNTKETDEKMPINVNLPGKESLINLKNFPRKEETKKIKGNKELYEVPEGVEVLTVDAQGNINWSHPIEFSVHKELNMIEIYTHKGKSLQITEDHGLTSLDPNLNITKAKAELDLLIPSVKPISFENPITSIELNLENKPDRKHTFKNSLELNYDTGYFLGVMVGDGWGCLTQSSKALVISSTTPDINNKIKKVVEDYIINEESVNIRESSHPHDFNGHSSLSGKITMALGDFAIRVADWIGKGAHNKHLPEFFISSTISFRKGLLAGLIDTDGTVNINDKGQRKDKPQTNISYSTVSRRLAHEIVALAHSLDLTASITYSKTPKGEDFYYVVFNSESIIKIKKLLKLYHPRKKENLENTREDMLVNREKYGPPISKERILEICKMIGSPRIYDKKTKLPLYDEAETERLKARKKLYNSCYESANKKNGRCGHLTLANCRDVMALNLPAMENDPFWVKWKYWVEKEDVSWERIVDIKPLPEFTEAYDLTIPPHYTMVTEAGLVAWDTMSVHIPMTDDSIQDAINMLPSKNLFNPLDKAPMHKPDQEPIMGLHLLSTPIDNKEIKKFSSKDEAIRAYRKGDIGVRDPIEIASLKK